MAPQHHFRVLILTAGFGDGHNAAARGVQAAIGRLSGGPDGPEIVSAICDIFDATHPRLSRLLKDSYRFGIVHLPALWRRLYDLSDRVSFKDDSLGLFRKISLRLKAILQDYEPHAVVLTYPFYPQLLESIIGRHGSLPFSVFTVVTDAVSINQTWLKGRTDHFLVTDEESRQTLVAGGIPAAKVRASGFPIDPVFQDLLEDGLRDDRFEGPPRVLYFPSTPVRHVERTLKALLPLAEREGLQLTIVLGRHLRRLSAAMERWRARFPNESLAIIGWTDAVPRLLREHHAVIGKAGGASVQEAFAARRPLLVNYVVPGQEEGNARQIVDAGCGFRIEDPQLLAPTLRALFANDGRLWCEMTARAARVSRPGAAIDIARLVVDSLPRPVPS